MIDNNSYALVEDLPGYVKDLNSKALINTNESELLLYKQRKLQTRQIEHLTEQINILSIEIDKIKQVLDNLVKNS